ncbi:MAG: hydrogenase maturation protease [Cyanobacteria bacterium J083]|nr:MAG: hydrogenase maturation protease [Cyanobacteria bacterium J083]
MCKSLVIGYGNSLRNDDAIGSQVAEIVATWGLAGVRSLALPQLTPELATDLAQVDLAIFVDACPILMTNKVKLISLQPLDYQEIQSHFSQPSTLLALTQTLYKKCPKAWWLIVPGVNFALGDSLSSVAQQGITQALIEIKNLLSTVK